MLVDGGLELALAHRLQQGRVVGQFQRDTAARNASARSAPSRPAPGPIACAGVGDPGGVAVGRDQPGAPLPVVPQRARSQPGVAPRVERPLRRLRGQLLAEDGLAGVHHLSRRASISGDAPRAARSAHPARHAPRRGRFFSRPAVKSRGDAAQPGQRLGGDGVEHVLDPAGRRSRARGAPAGTRAAPGPPGTARTPRA